MSEEDERRQRVKYTLEFNLIWRAHQALQRIKRFVARKVWPVESNLQQLSRFIGQCLLGIFR